jgi:hypothetical protein
MKKLLLADLGYSIKEEYKQLSNKAIKIILLFNHIPVRPEFLPPK